MASLLWTWRLFSALGDGDPGVRRHAVRLSEPLLATTPQLCDRVLKLAADDDPLVRLQVAYSLGAWGDERAGNALGAILLRDAGDPYITAAAMSSVGEQQLPGVLAVVLRPSARRPADPPPQESLAKLVVVAAAYKNESALVKILDRVSQSDNGNFESWQIATLSALFDMLDRHNQSLTQLQEGASAELKDAIARLSPILDSARRIVADTAAADDKRIAMLPLLAKSPSSQQSDADLLARLLVPQSSAELQIRGGRGARASGR